MYKEDFLEELQRKLTGLPQSDIDEQLSYYSEMIDDRMEEGMEEEYAIAEIGPVHDIVSQIVSETSLTTLVREKVKPKRSLRAWEIVLLVLGSPIWVSLLIAAFSILLSVYIVLWSAVLSLYAADLSLALGALACIPATITYLGAWNPIGALFIVGAGFILAGLAILMFFACLWITKGVLMLTKAIILGIKSLFVGKEDIEHAYA